MLVHAVGAGQQFLEVGHADGQRDGQADSRPQRITTADPIPHRENVFFANTERDRRFVVARHRNEVAMQFSFGAALRQIPGAGGLGVLQGFEGVERFGRNNEQGGFGANLVRQLVEFTAVDIRQVMAANTFLRVGQQRFGHQLWAQERAADTDVHNVGDGLFGITAPQAFMNATDQFGHLVQDFMHLGHDVRAIDRELVGHRATQCRVQGRTAFGGVDDFAREQRFDCTLEVDFVGQIDQQRAGFVGDQVFRVVQEQPAAAQGEIFKTFGVAVKRVAHAEMLHAGAVLLQRLPSGQSGNVMRSAVVRHRCGYPFLLELPVGH